MSLALSDLKSHLKVPKGVALSPDSRFHTIATYWFFYLLINWSHPNGYYPSDSTLHSGLGFSSLAPRPKPLTTIKGVFIWQIWENSYDRLISTNGFCRNNR
jgi:hypothetical protein